MFGFLAGDNDNEHNYETSTSDNDTTCSESSLKSNEALHFLNTIPLIEQSEQCENSGFLRIERTTSAATSILENAAFILVNEDGKREHVAIFASSVISLGIILGCIVAYQSDSGNGWVYVNECFGYIFFLSWTISNWPQLLLNMRIKSTEGLSPDYVVSNLVGFVSYAVFNSVFYWSTTVSNAYKNDHNDDEVVIENEDVFLALQTTVLVLIIAFQIIWYNSSSVYVSPSRYCCGLYLLPTDAVKLSAHYSIIITGLVGFVVGYFFLVLLVGGKLHKDGTGVLNWTDFVFSLSYIKLVSTLIKYLPQILLNRKRQSTSGFNVWTAVFDFIGGLFSFLQVLSQSIYEGSADHLKVHIVKTLVGLMTVIKNYILMMQHYVWYAPNGDQRRNHEMSYNNDYHSIDPCGSQDHPIGQYSILSEDTDASLYRNPSTTTSARNLLQEPMDLL